MNRAWRIVLGVVVFALSFVVVYFPVQVAVATTVAFLGLFIGWDYSTEFAINTSIVVNLSIAIAGTSFLCYLFTKWVLKKATKRRDSA